FSPGIPQDRPQITPERHFHGSRSGLRRAPAMHCPCRRATETRAVDSRTADDGAAIRRRRQCPECGRRFTTAENATLVVVKRSGATEPFSRSKVLVALRKVCQARH